jgi:hypothetical protein
MEGPSGGVPKDKLTQGTGLSMPDIRQLSQFFSCPTLSRRKQPLRRFPVSEVSDCQRVR